jgi:transposase
MTCFVGLDVSPKMTAICVDNTGRRLWRGQCVTVPEQVSVLVRRHAGDNETGAMTPWLVHELRNLGLEVVCLDARHARAALEMQIDKTDQNDAEGLANIVVVQVCSCQIIRQPPRACSSWRKDAARRDYHAIVQSHSRRAQNVWSFARRDTGTAIRSKG